MKSAYEFIGHKPTVLVKVKKEHSDAIVPKYQTEGAGCFDLHACLESVITISQSQVGSAKIRTGLSFEIPEGYVMLVFSRSGHGFKHDVSLANGTGVIDSDYRGEVLVKLTVNTIKSPAVLPLTINNGDRIAQAMIIPVPKTEFEEVKELSKTDRGVGGFGSTGV